MTKGNNRCLVSIITPSYNSARFIAQAVDSVQAQTYEDWEMLIVDDCSQDNTCEIVKKKMKNDNRIRLIQLADNSGPALARNCALKEANGRYIAFLDSDDLWLHEKLERQINFMKEDGIAFSFSEYRCINEAGDKCGKLIQVPKIIDYRGLLKNTIIGCLTVVIDKLKTGPFELINMPREDYILWFKLLKRGFLAYGFQEDLARYRVVGGSDSRNKIRAALLYWRNLRKIESLGITYSFWCFANYGWNAYKKNRNFW